MKKEYLITEKPWKALLLFAMPMIIGNLFQQFYTMVDSIVVGRFVSENALAAVGASYALTTVFISIAIGGGVGASVITSRYFGARDYRKMMLSIRTALTVFLVTSVVLGGVGLLLGKQIMIALNTPSDVLGDATIYLNIYFLGLPFLFMYNILSAMFNALGRSQIPLYLLIFSSLFNIVLDIFFVKNLMMGVSGVAWATLIAQGISAVLSFMILLRELGNYKVEEKLPFFDKVEFSLMARVALPSILQQSTISIGMMLVQSVVNSFGAQVLAGFSATMRVESICIVPMSAMGNVMSSYTAQNIGAGKMERVKQGYHTGYGIVAVFAVILCLIVELSCHPLVLLFLGEDASAAAYQTGVGYLRFIGWFFVFVGIKMITDGLLRGAGDMAMFTVANMVNLGIRVFASMIFAPRFGVEVVWIVVPIGWIANYLISLAEYRTGKWERIHSGRVRESEAS
ncbi:MAG: MATE family efflux transporter [Lachnospiraceae bacterium]|jgi:putative MATE family efflux protein|nr:MATE family efflux transporter [Lachnospiraceae bacterium]